MKESRLYYFACAYLKIKILVEAKLNLFGQVIRIINHLSKTTHGLDLAALCLFKKRNLN